jgi:hypothetical protein
MTSLALRNDAMTETYLDVKDDINRTVLQIYAKYGRVIGSVDDLLADANLLFVQAYDRFDRNRGASFSTWVRGFVWRGLTELVRRRVNKNRLAKKIVHREVYIHHEFDFVDLLDSLSDDAKHVIKLVVQTPKELMEIMSQGQPARKCLVSYLKEVGWNQSRISETFSEIGSALIS